MGRLRVNVAVVQKEGAYKYIIVCPLLSLPLHYTHSRYNQPDKTTKQSHINQHAFQHPAHTHCPCWQRCGALQAPRARMARRLLRGARQPVDLPMYVSHSTQFTPTQALHPTLPTSAHILAHPLTLPRRQRQRDNRHGQPHPVARDRRLRLDQRLARPRPHLR